MVNVWTHMGHISVSALLRWFLHLTTHAALKVKSYINTYVPENPKPHHQIPIVYFTINLTLNSNPGGLHHSTFWISSLSSHYLISRVLHDLNWVSPISEPPKICIVGVPRGAGLRNNALNPLIQSLDSLKLVFCPLKPYTLHLKHSRLNVTPLSVLQ